MQPFVTITFPSGHVYEVPTSIVAADRTSYYAMCDPGRSPEQHAFETAELFKSEFELFDWMKNNMNWSDIEKAARLIGFKAFEMQSMWDDATLQTSSEPGKSKLSDLGEKAGQAPLEFAIAQAVSDHVYCSISGFGTDGRNVDHAIVALVGGAEIVHGYIAALTSFNEFMLKQAAEAKASGEAPASANHH